MQRWLWVALLLLCAALNLLNTGSHHHSTPRWFWSLWWQSRLIWRWSLLPLLVLVVGSLHPANKPAPAGDEEER